MRVAMITGSYPPSVCGIGDYTSKLVEALSASGIEVEVYSGDIDWSLYKAKELADRIAATSPDVVHIQYPATGYGHKLGPQALSLMLKPCIVTLHEFSQVHWLRKLSLYSFCFGAEHFIFTSDFERSYAAKFAPWIEGRSCAIPIGSFISSSAEVCEKELLGIVSFGLIRPDKGIEKLIELAALIKLKGLPLKVRIIGAVDPKQPDYIEKLRIDTSDLPITWEIGLSAHKVSSLLARSRIAYMPFPDGASERRSSLLAVLLNGVVTVSTQGRFTTNELMDTLAFAESPEQALQIIQQILEQPERLKALAQRSREYAQRRDWNQIASQHIALYRST